MKSLKLGLAIIGISLLGIALSTTSYALYELPTLEPGDDGGSDWPSPTSPTGDNDLPEGESGSGTGAPPTDPALCPNVNTLASWQSLGTTNWYSINSGEATSKGFKTRNNCPVNVPTATEITDDYDNTRALTEDNYKGGNIPQLCLGTSDSDIEIVSEWSEGSCPSGTVDVGVYDSATTNYSNPDGKRYYHRHNFNEEDDTSNGLRWCLKVESPNDNYQLSSRKVSGVNSCASDEAYLFYSDNTRWNMNNEDHPDRTSFCLKVSPKPGAICGVAPTANLTVNGSEGPLAVTPGSALNLNWTSTGAASCTASSSPVTAWAGARPTVGNEAQTFGSAITVYSITCTNAAGTAVDSVTVDSSAPSTVADLKINGSDGPLSVGQSTPLSITWTSTNTTSCAAYGAGWGSGGGVPTSSGTPVVISANASDTYIIQCTGPSGTATDSVQVTLTNTLKVCQNSCSSGVQRGNVNTTQSFTLAQGGVQNLVACYNPAPNCTDSTGDVTTSTAWSETPSNTVSLSGTNPKVVTGNQAGTEGISASYNSQTNNMSVTVTCVPTVSCDNAPGRENYCQDQPFEVDNGCGINITCNGTKTCDYNWKEVAP